MKFFKYTLLLLLTMGPGMVHLSAQDDQGQDTDFERQLEDKEGNISPVRDFVESKENISLVDKAQKLELSGDVRFKWRNRHEKSEVIFINPKTGHIHEKYTSLRGGDAKDAAKVPISCNNFNVEMNFKLKYTYGRSWFGSNVQYENSAGIKARNTCVSKRSLDDFTIITDSREGCKGSGESGNVNLKRAYMGYNIYADGKHRLDIEVGRRKMDDIFDSEIEFSNRFDGVVLKYASAIDGISDWYYDIGVFVIDERVNNFGSAFEVGFLGIYDTGLDLKYSLINWIGNGRTRCLDDHEHEIRYPLGYQFKISQFLFDYHFEPSFTSHRKAEFYGAFLINHAAKKRCVTRNKLQNMGGYIGLYFGEVEDSGDWSLDIMYAIVQAQAIPECDVGGIGRGNLQDENLTDIVSIKDKNGTVVDVIVAGRGNTNYKGWKFEFLYGITDELSVDILYQFSHAADSKIGGRHYFEEFKLESIYAF